MPRAIPINKASSSSLSITTPKSNGIAPAQADLQRYFQVSPPSVHRMLTQLEDKGLIRKQPGVARGLSLAIPVYQLPALDWFSLVNRSELN